MTEHDYDILREERPELKLPGLSSYTHFEHMLLRTVKADDLVARASLLTIAGVLTTAQRNMQFFMILRDIGDMKKAYAADGFRE